eukprot:8287559-Pyramimonas_sp.AAC.1
MLLTHAALRLVRLVGPAAGIAYGFAGRGGNWRTEVWRGLAEWRGPHGWSPSKGRVASSSWS